MLCPIVAPHNPGCHELNEIYSMVCQRALIPWEENIQMTLPYFCNYSPCREDLNLHLNKLEFSSCSNGLYQV